MDQLGTIESIEDGYRVCMGLDLEQAPPTIWRMLTEPDAVARWLAPGEVEAIEGGRARINCSDRATPVDSPVRYAEAYRVLEYAWSTPGERERPIRWELEPTETGTRLTLVLKLSRGEDAAWVCAAWEAHLDMLMSTLAGEAVRFPLERFTAARRAYHAVLAG